VCQLEKLGHRADVVANGLKTYKEKKLSFQQKIIQRNKGV